MHLMEKQFILTELGYGDFVHLTNRQVYNVLNDVSEKDLRLFAAEGRRARARQVGERETTLLSRTLVRQEDAGKMS